MPPEEKHHLCPVCRTPLANDRRTCPTCGSDIDAPKEWSEEQRELPADEPRGRTPPDEDAR